MPVLWKGPMQKSAKKLPPLFSYTGNYAYTDWTDPDGTVHFELALLSSGTLTFTRVVPEIDLTLVGAGQKGGTGYRSGTYAYGGKGGDGGDIERQTGVAVSTGTSYSVQIGVNDANSQSGDEDTTFGSYSSANGQAGKTGPSGAEAGGPGGLKTAAGQADDGEAPFADGTSALYPNVLFGAPGGGGAAFSSGGYSGSASSGGETGGGDGGTSGNLSGNAGAANRGAGGGGGWGGNQGYVGGSYGGSGIALIRDAV